MSALASCRQVQIIDEPDNEGSDLVADSTSSLDESDNSDSDLEFDAVVRQEFALLNHNREERAKKLGLSKGSDSETPRFSLAFSGGGVRAAAFEAGVLWRLAEEGCLKDIEHFVVVSGGAYIASAFASHIVAAGAPAEGETLDSWYLSIVAATIGRMQANISYILSDFISNPCFLPRYGDGSRSVPRLCDLPVVICYAAFTLLYNPLTMMVMALIPFTELVNALFGFYMRVALCNLRKPGLSPTDEKFLERSPFVRNCLILISLLLISVILLNFSCWALGKIWTRSRQPSGKTRCPIFLWVTSAQAMLMRLAVLLAILLATVMGVFVCEVGSGWHYRGSCAGYIQSVLLDNDGTGSVTKCTDNVLFSIHGNITDCIHCIRPNSTDCPTWCHAKQSEHVASWQNSQGWILYGKWSAPGLRLLGFVFLIGLAFLTLLLPFYGIKALEKALMVVGPVVLIVFIGFLISYRVFGPLTGQPFPYGSVGNFDDNTWDTIVRWCVLGAALLLPIHPWLLTSMHTFYRRSLRMAFFHAGEDITWLDVVNNAFCPFLIMTGTVSDYKHPDYTHSTSEIFFSGAYMGGKKIGYVETPPWISVAKCMALTGAASDAAVLGVLSRSAYTFHRFWLELTNLNMGDNIFFERRPHKIRKWADDTYRRAESLHAISKSARHSSCQFEEGWVRCWDRIPTLIISELVFVFMFVGLHLMKYESECTTGRTLFFVATSLQLVLYMLSFFAFVRCLECTLFSVFNRRAHMAMGYKHEAYIPPRHIHVTDGGVMDPSGILELLRRRCKRILVVQCVNDPKDELNMLKRTLALAEGEHLASFYDPRDPMVGVEYIYDEFELDPLKTHLHIGVRYDPQNRQNKSEVGLLLIVKLRLPEEWNTPVPPLLSEEEIISGESEPAPVSDELGHLKQSELGGGWFSCFHRNGCNCGAKFPHLSNSNQFLTPELFSCLCRLGHRLSGDAVKTLCQADVLDPSNTNPSSLNRPFGTTPEDLQRAEDRQDRFRSGFVC